MTGYTARCGLAYILLCSIGLQCPLHVLCSSSLLWQYWTVLVDIAADCQVAPCRQILGQGAVHGAFAGFTGFTVGLVNTHYVYLPIPVIIQVRSPPHPLLEDDAHTGACLVLEQGSKGNWRPETFHICLQDCQQVLLPG